MMIKLYLPRETTALSLGAQEVAESLLSTAETLGKDVLLTRTGSRGLFWLEPLLEVETPLGRVAYGPLTVEDVESVLTLDIEAGAVDHNKCLGLVEKIPYLAKQQRLTFSKAGIIDPSSINDYYDNDGYTGLKKFLAQDPQKIVDEVVKSGLRGRGGAAFPTGIKWQTVKDTIDQQKYIVCNADEGDSGTFADRLLMESDPFCLIEGMTLAGIAVGANRGYIYLREEYPNANIILQEAIDSAYQHQLLGKNILNSGHHFDLQIRIGAGAYICGEETSLLESLEGRRGLVRAKPPIPALKGLFGKPTVVNNVLSFAAVPYITAHGGDSYASYGQGRSTGTMPFQLAGNVKHGGLVELAFGITLRQLVEDFGAGSFSEKPLKAIQIGGPLGAYLPTELWDTPMEYEALSAISAGLGHGGLVLHDETSDLAKLAQFAMEFCVVESCGKCTPCRIGSTRGVEVIERIRLDQNRAENTILLHDLCETMIYGSLCAMGSMTPIPVQSALKYFPSDFGLTSGDGV